MPTVFIPFTGWSPSGSYFGEGWQTTTNLYPSFNAWRPWRKFKTVGAGVAGGPMTGAYCHLYPSGIGGGSYSPDGETVFCGSPAALYVLDPAAGTFTVISRAAPYSANPGGWRFTSVGNDIWATNWIDVPQRRTNNAGNFADGVTSTFVPRPRFLRTLREHLLGANLSNAGRFQDELVWSDADNAVNFDPPTGTSTSLAGSKRLTSIPGQITGLLGGQYGLAWKKFGVYYLEATGTTQVVRPEVLSAKVGTAFPSSIVNGRSGTYFRGHNGFYVIRGLAEPVQISDNGVDWWFFQNGGISVFTGTPWAEDFFVAGFEHPALPLVGWFYGSSALGSGSSAALLYNYVEDRWSVGAVDVGGSAVSIPVERIEAPVYQALGSFTYSGGTSRYVSLSNDSSVEVQAPLLELRYRPANFENANQYQQSLITGVLPVFSKTSASGTALTPEVRVSPLLNPHGSPGMTEVRPASERDSISGVYPFQTASRHFLISIVCAAEDFANFEGVWVHQELLR